MPPLRWTTKKATLWGLACLFFFAAGASLVAQGSAAATETVVGDIDVEFDQLQNVSDEAVLARVQLRPGMAFSQTLVDRSIRSLYAMRLFDYVEARTEPMAGGQVRIIFKVQAKYRARNIRYEGNDEASDRRLRRETGTRRGRAIDERQINRDVAAMLTYYREKGFTNVEIDYEITRDETTGFGDVTFLIDEGERIEIDRVNFIGNEAFSAGDLRGEMKTKRRWFLSWLTGSGRFDEKDFQEDLDRLRTLYLNEGYLDVSIPEANVTLEYPKPDEILLTIRVDEGRRYRVGNIRFEGNELFPEFRLATQLNLLPGDFFSPETLDEDVERLRNLYGAIGYLDARIRPEREANLETGDIDLIYRVTEGEQFDVESIIIEGNTKTKSTVVIRELSLAPGRTFNLVFMDVSEARLKNTRFFDEVNLSHEATNIPGRRNLKIRLREGRTGNFQFGAGFNSLENAVVFFEVSQSNFDLFKWRSPFLQGDGQKFRLRGSLGKNSNEVVLNFEEPWLFEQRLAAGIDLYRRETDFNSAIYNELRTGTRLYLRKRLFGLVDGQLAYTLEQVELSDFQRIRLADGSLAPDPNVLPTVIFEEAQVTPRLVSKLDFTLVRDTRNDLIFTTRGSRTQLRFTFAGIGGDTEYAAIETRNAIFVPTFELGDQVLSVLLRAGSIWEYSDQSVPFFDRFYLGGPDTLRGFEFREAGGSDTLFEGRSTGARLEPLGGRSYGFGSLEYSVKVADPLRLALFYDWGFLNRDEFDFDPTTYNDNWGFGVRLLVLGNPLRLDYGIPITVTEFPNGQDNDQGAQFNFSFGTRF